MKKIIFVLLFALNSFFIYAQNFSEPIDVKDAFEENDNDNLTLRFYNALNGEPIKNGNVKISEIGEFITDYEGKVIFPAPDEDGLYRVIFKKNGFITTEFDIEIMAGTLIFNRCSISPTMELEYVRIVLDWDENPKDLDAHFVKNGDYHISYRNMRASSDGYAILDRDDIDSFGPETITIKKIDNFSDYEYFVHDYTNKDYSNSKKLSESKATVKVYGNGKLLNIFHITGDKKGNIWRVFKIQNGNIIEINEVSKN